MENRRIFTRVLFSIDARLTVNNIDYPVSLHDISMSGALIKCSVDKPDLADQTGILHFSLDGEDSKVSMNVTIVHEHDSEIRLHCNSIDLDSISILRRLIELNLGDSEQLNKELSQLSYSHE
ncbi:PilZ domain-containing protein [Colwellia sp. RE-S-Sl-9]